MITYNIHESNTTKNNSQGTNYGKTNAQTTYYNKELQCKTTQTEQQQIQHLKLKQ